MFNFLKKKTQGEQVLFNIDGMHCASCAMNIDMALEETQGVIEAKTSYAKSQVQICFNPEKIKLSQLKKIIAKEGYRVQED